MVCDLCPTPAELIHVIGINRVCASCKAEARRDVYLNHPEVRISHSLGSFQAVIRCTEERQLMDLTITRRVVDSVTHPTPHSLQPDRK